MDINKIVDETLDAEKQLIIVEDALELLRQGYPLDEETELALESIGVDPDDFTRRFEAEETRRLFTKD